MQICNSLTFTGCCNLWDFAMDIFKQDMTNRPKLYEQLIDGSIYQVECYRNNKDINFCQIRNVVEILINIEVIYTMANLGDMMHLDV